MAIKAKVQRDYYLTEVSVSLPAQVSDVDEILRATKTSGKMVTVYNEGFIQGINVEQRTKLTEKQAEQIRKILAIEDTPV